MGIFRKVSFISIFLFPGLLFAQIKYQAENTNSLFNLGRFDEATSLGLTSLENPQLSTNTKDTIRHTLAWGYYNRKDYLSALSTFQDIADHYPNSIFRGNSLYMTAKTYEELTEYNKAIEVYKKVIDEYPGSNRSRESDIQIISLMGKMDIPFDELLKEVEERNKSNYPRVRMAAMETIVTAYLKNGMREEAIDWIEREVKKHPAIKYDSFYVGIQESLLGIPNPYRNIVTSTSNTKNNKSALLTGNWVDRIIVNKDTAVIYELLKQIQVETDSNLRREYIQNLHLVETFNNPKLSDKAAEIASTLLLNEQNIYEKGLLCNTLGQLKSPIAVPTLEKVLLETIKNKKSENIIEPFDMSLYYIQGSAVNALANCGPKGIGVLVKQLKNPASKGFASTIISALGYSKDSSLVPVIVPYLKDNYFDMKVTVCNSLISLSKESSVINIVEDELYPLLFDSNPESRRSAVRTLGRLRDKKLIDVFQKLLEDSYQWQDTRWIDGLKQDVTDYPVREEAQKAIDRANSEGPTPIPYAE